MTSSNASLAHSSLARATTAIAASLLFVFFPTANFGATLLYKLTEGSAHQEGCFEPCMCPIMFNDTLQGTFVFEPVVDKDKTVEFYVRDVRWSFLRGEDSIPVSGSGLYTIDGEQHRLELDLQLGDQPPQHFDSGLVRLSGEFPALSIAVAVNGFFCYDYVFSVEAEPVAVNQQPETWGALKSTYR